MKWLVHIGWLIFIFNSCNSTNNKSTKKVSTDEIIGIRNDVNNNKESLQKLMKYYIAYKDHFISKKTVGDFDFELMYNTHFSLAVNSLDTVVYRQTKTTLVEELKKFEKLHYFTFRLSNKKEHAELLKYDIKSEQEYTDRILYYMNKCQTDFTLIEDGDTLIMPFVNFERTFDLAPVITITVVFERKKNTNFNHLDFVFDDKIFNNGKIKFEMEPEIISVFNNPDIKNYNL